MAKWAEVSLPLLRGTRNALIIAADIPNRVKESTCRAGNGGGGGDGQGSGGQCSLLVGRSRSRIGPHTNRPLHLSILSLSFSCEWCCDSREEGFVEPSMLLPPPPLTEAAAAYCTHSLTARRHPRRFLSDDVRPSVRPGGRFNARIERERERGQQKVRGE